MEKKEESAVSALLGKRECNFRPLLHKAERILSSLRAISGQFQCAFSDPPEQEAMDLSLQSTHSVCRQEVMMFNL